MAPAAPQWPSRPVGKCGPALQRLDGAALASSSRRVPCRGRETASAGRLEALFHGTQRSRCESDLASIGHSQKWSNA
eukprot:3227473-Alexandrium_andersonii.AAC.1